MGRGRAKAKQVKVARQLKYSGGGTDLDRLRAELGVGTDEQEADRQAAYADFSDRYSVDDEDSDDDVLDDGEGPDGGGPDGEGYDVESLADDPVDRYSGDGGSPAARMSRTTGA
jgi:Protein of unknown function (DUF3073)